MISENVSQNSVLIDEIIYFHKNGVLSNDNVPGLVISDSSTIRVDYGFNNNKNGSIVIKRGQFEVVQITDDRNHFQNLRSYNHYGLHRSKQDFINALKSRNLQLDKTHVSALIILTSECCRSKMVFDAIYRLLEHNINFSDEICNGLHFAFNNYAHTAAYVGYNILAGKYPWTWLRIDDYLKYIEKKYNGDKEDARNSILAVKDYIARNYSI